MSGPALRVREGIPALKFSRLARAVRQWVSLYGLVLEDGLVEKAKALGPLIPPSPPEPPPWEIRGQTEADWDRQQRINHRAARAHEAIEKVIEEMDSGLVQDRLIVDLADRFESDADDDLFASDTPIAQVIAEICKALNFKPDWRSLDEDDCDLEPADLARLRIGRFAPAGVPAFEAAIPPPDPSAQPPPPWPG